MLDSLVRVSRRAAYGHYASALRPDGRRSSVPTGRVSATGCKLPPPKGRVTFPSPFCGRRNRRWPARRRDDPVPEGIGLSVDGRVCPQALPFQQFHVLFDSLSKVLFIFRSLYLCAIGLWPVFSLGRNLPPALSCIPKQLDSSKGPRTGVGTPTAPRDSHPLRRPVPRDLGTTPPPRHPLQITTRVHPSRADQISNLGSCRFTRRY